MGAIPSKASFAEFRNYFTQFGELDDICLPMKDKVRGINRGHGFVTYKSTEDARCVMDKFDKHSIRDKWVEVKIAKPRSSKSPNYKAFQSDTTKIDIRNTIQRKTLTDSSSSSSEEEDFFRFGSNQEGRLTENKKSEKEMSNESIKFLNFMMSARTSLKRKSIKGRRESFAKHEVFKDSNKVSLRSFKTFNEADKRYSEQVFISEEQRKLFENTQKRFSLIEKGGKCYLHKNCSCFKK